MSLDIPKLPPDEEMPSPIEGHQQPRRFGKLRSRRVVPSSHRIEEQSPHIKNLRNALESFSTCQTVEIEKKIFDTIKSLVPLIGSSQEYSSPKTQKLFSKIFSEIVKKAHMYKDSPESTSEEYALAQSYFEWLSDTDLAHRYIHLYHLATMYYDSDQIDHLKNLLTKVQAVKKTPTSYSSDKLSLQQQIQEIFQDQIQAPAIFREQKRSREELEEPAFQTALSVSVTSFLQAPPGTKKSHLDPMKKAFLDIQKEQFRATKRMRLKTRTDELSDIGKAKVAIYQYLATIETQAQKSEEWILDAQACLNWLSEIDSEHEFEYVERKIVFLLHCDKLAEATSQIENLAALAPDPSYSQKSLPSSKTELLIFAKQLCEYMKTVSKEALLQNVCITLTKCDDESTALSDREKLQLKQLHHLITGSHEERVFLRTLVTDKSLGSGRFIISWLEKLSLAKMQGVSCTDSIQRLTRLLEVSKTLSTFASVQDAFQEMSIASKNLQALFDTLPDSSPEKNRLSTMIQELTFLGLTSEDSVEKRKAIHFLLSGRSLHSIKSMLNDLLLAKQTFFSGRDALVDPAIKELLSSSIDAIQTALPRIESFLQGYQDILLFCQQNTTEKKDLSQTNFFSEFNSLALYSSDEIEALEQKLQEKEVFWGELSQDLQAARALYSKINSILSFFPATLPGDILFEDENLQDLLRGRPEESFSSLPLTASNVWKVLTTFLEKKSVFSVQPFFTGAFQHASLSHSVAGDQLDLKAGSGAVSSPISPLTLLSSITLRPNFVSILTEDGLRAMHELFGTRNKEELQERLTQVYEHVMQEIIAQNQEQLQKIEVSQWKSALSMFGNTVLKCYGEFWHLLDSVLQKNLPQGEGSASGAAITREAEQLTQKMFCSEFVATMLQHSFSELDSFLKKQLPSGFYDPKKSFFIPLFPEGILNEALYPNKLAEILQRKTLYTRQKPHFMFQLLSTSQALPSSHIEDPEKMSEAY